MTTNVAAIVLTYNEEANIAQVLQSVHGWAQEIVVVDSYSTDRTVDIAQTFGARVYKHEFENCAQQRNWALTDIPIESEWVLFLDADEWLMKELKEEIARVIASNPSKNGFLIKWRFMWMGVWIRRGYYPTWVLRLVRRGTARCERRCCNEHLVVEGEAGFLNADFVHEDRKSISDWITKHNRYATLEGLELLNAERIEHDIPLRFRHGSQVERKRWLRYKVWNRMPPLFRPVIYFVYRIVLCGGFLDGPRAWVYHVLQALWYPLLIDIKYLELLAASRPSAGDSPAISQTAEVGK